MREKGIPFLSVDLAYLSGSRVAATSESMKEREGFQVATVSVILRVSGMPSEISSRGDQPILRRRFSEKISGSLISQAG